MRVRRYIALLGASMAIFALFHQSSILFFGLFNRSSHDPRTYSVEVAAHVCTLIICVWFLSIMRRQIVGTNRQRVNDDDEKSL